MNIKHLKGFTILEVLITLVLMSIIISITFSLFNLMGKQLSLFEKENTQVLEYNLFNTTLLRDIDKANNFSYAESDLVLKFYDETEVNYTVNSKYILRNNHIKIDTFKLRVNGYQFINSDEKTNNNTTFLLSLKVLNDTINANYFLSKNNSDIINNSYFNED
ncbi:prepilin-type N-terminal cleavage/methylation domain-containing protein [Mariniflexile litorale]|uniref:Prepilin-type N-terminal cleavage/methylation domain-containing protein n=1 Tax=Mariniflexile litorale TaxID=3045158 RepID=A0AAU7EK93_9FLAO|nr:prepilin-type N-terminal cleavage/methylation domain-containing protein [Mariniflexile sp. KMM 9835]MDQ8213256.1 prepilin-type N-terminal cleavage/methylation domain-containing protein [Mariniflexile sp. KMM 9835]